MYTIDQLKDMAEPYLKERESILATDDGQFFYDTPDGRNSARNYAFRQKVKVFCVSKDEIVIDKLLDKVGVNPPEVVPDQKKDEAKAAKEAEKAAAKAAKK